MNLYLWVADIDVLLSNFFSFMRSKLIPLSAKSAKLISIKQLTRIEENKRKKNVRF